MKQEAPLHALASYLPEGTFDQVIAYITEYKVHLTITRERQSVLGDYRHPYENKGHRISVNGGRYGNAGFADGHAEYVERNWLHQPKRYDPKIR